MTAGSSALGSPVLVGGDEPLSALLAGRLEAKLVAGPVRPEDLDGAGAVVFLPGDRGAAVRSGAPDPDDAEAVLAACAAAAVPRWVVVSSAAVWEPSHHHPGHTAEEPLGPCRERNALVAAWRRLEVDRHLAGHAGTTWTVLRPTPVPMALGRDFWSRWLRRPVGLPLPGHDPSVQLLDWEDLAEAVRRALSRADPADREMSGVFHVAPAGVIPLRRAVALRGALRLPMPGWLQRLLLRERPGHLEQLRYPWTVSGERARRELGFVPRYDSAATVLRASGRDVPAQAPPRFDDFGLDPAYVAAFGRTLFRFLHDVYWRVELAGLAHLPRTGRAVLAGTHRGFMPFDGVMALYAVHRVTGRIPRFLIHPTLVKLPFLANYMTRLGGIHACRENAARVLEADEILGIFPEGIRGAFALYRDAYRLRRFGRDDYVKLAIRHRSPIVPFVTVGSAEIFPIFKKLRWRWWRRWSEWPCLPLTPTFPWLPPVPLPSKWHTRFLPPLHVEERYPPEAAEDPEVVRAVSGEVRRRMEEALAGILARRRSIFFGSVFEDREELEEEPA